MKNMLDQFCLLIEHYHRKYRVKVTRASNERTKFRELLLDLVDMLKHFDFTFERENSFKLYHTEYDKDQRIIYLSKQLFATLETLEKPQGKRTKNDPIPSLEKKQ